MTIRLFIALIFCAAGLLPQPARIDLESPVGSMPSPRLLDPRSNVSFLPIAFEPNSGQSDEAVRFLAHGSGYNLFLTESEAVFQLQRPNRGAEGGEVLRMSFGGQANAAPKIEGDGLLAGKSNYFIGNDRNKWRTGVANFSSVVYRDLYPGIDLRFHGERQSMPEYDFIIAPGADSRLARLVLHGPESLRIDDGGNLEIGLGTNVIRQHRPVAFQEQNGKRKIVQSSYVIRAKNEIGFEVAEYDHSLPLVIDPVISVIFSTYLGGAGAEPSRPKIAVDSAGNVYMTGTTTSTNFPTSGSSGRAGLRAQYAGGLTDVFVCKFDPIGRSLIFSTYLGGSDEELQSVVAFDSLGAVYVAGETSSMADFPIRWNLSPHRGRSAAFVAKLSSAGDALVYSTFLGGSGTTYAYAVAVDGQNAAYVTGYTEAADFPVKSAVQRTLRGTADVFLSKINPAGTQLVYSTFFGGSAADLGIAVAVDAYGRAFVFGDTLSSNFPLRAPFRSASGAQQDLFLTAFLPAGTLFFSTYLDGSTHAEAGDIKAANGSVYLIGSTSGEHFPVKNAFQSTMKGGIYDAFVMKFDGTRPGPPIYSTFIGGSSYELGLGITVDSDDYAYITGWTDSVDFPTKDPLQNGLGGGADAFIVELEPQGDKLKFSTFFGGPETEVGSSIALDAKRDIYIAGQNNFGGLPTKNAFQPSSGGATDDFLLKLGKAGRVYLR